jgi:hypothetical protein
MHAPLVFWLRQACSGKAIEAIEMMKKAMRLSSYHPDWYLGTLALAHLILDDYELALEVAKQQLALVTDRRIYRDGSDYGAPYFGRDVYASEQAE